MPIHILAIETSCDETAAALIQDGRSILSNVVASQIDLHRQYGGVFPEVASRQHVLAIEPVITEALARAGMGWTQITAIAVTRGPGLAGSLLVGVNTAKGLAWAGGLPLIGINHLEGHVYSNWLEAEDQSFSPRQAGFPILVLIVSGGHTELILMHDHGRYRRLGGTIDDAAGEAFDKVARILGLGYPGGPAMQKAAESGKPKAFDLPRALLPGTYDFSFSGLKTAALRQVQRLAVDAPQDLNRAAHLRPDVVSDLAASYQEAIAHVLCEKTRRAALDFKVCHICVCGGVSANGRIRQLMQERMPVSVSVPPLALCTDNAAMIGAAGYYRFMAGERSGWDLDVVAGLSLT